MACSQAIEFQPTLNCQATIGSSQAVFVVFVSVGRLPRTGDLVVGGLACDWLHDFILSPSPPLTTTTVITNHQPSESIPYFARLVGLSLSWLIL
ncbi:hypothetical protein FJTKL_14532 [Diaporthe vaccinii]|uniref:Uncharacterized protein n=1 Tax=Diaporthe vaccinii TaxID=105482 RepID=A0ABR4E744_9PEZI